MEFLLLILIGTIVIIYRKNPGESAYRFIVTQVSTVYNKYAPYSFKVVHEKVKELGLTYSVKQYTTQVIIFSIGAFAISYLYFYDIVISVIYVVLAILVIPYLAYLKYRKIYSEFIFEQIQVYTTNVIMEFMTTESFVKALEGVYASGVLEEPVLSDVKTMIDLAYEKGDITDAINFMNQKYNYYTVKNMHQLFLQITKEGSKDAREALENMLSDIDMLVEAVYRDRMDRASFHKTFVRYAFMLYLMVMLVQYLLGIDTYLKLLDSLIVKILLHAVVFINSFFLLGGEKYYCENVGAE